MDKNVDRLGRLKPEEKVNLAIDMSDAVVLVCAEGIKTHYLKITEKEQQTNWKICFAK